MVAGSRDSWTIGGIVSELEEHINKSQTPQMLDLDKKLSLMEEVCRRAQFLDPNTPDGYATLAAVRLGNGACGILFALIVVCGATAAVQSCDCGWYAVSVSERNDCDGCSGA